MLERFAGLRSQITLLKEKLKKHNPTKNPKVYKEILDALEAAEKRYSAEKAKRLEKQKAKEEVAKEAAPKVEDGTVSMPKKEFVDEHEKLVKELEPMVEEHKEQGAELKEVKESAAHTCHWCGGVEFPTQQAYQNHVKEMHPGKQPILPPEKPPVNEYKPMDYQHKKDIVKDVEHKLGPAIISEKEDSAELHKTGLHIDDIVEPVRGTKGSVGIVLREPNVNGDPLVYIKWIEGPKLQDEIGGYYPSDVRRIEAPVEEKVAEGNPPPPDTSVIPETDHCAKCADHQSKEADLKSNYDALLKDLKDEREAHYNQGNHPWVARLDQKIKELEEKIQEKFGNEKTSSAACDMCKGPVCERCKQCHKCVQINGSMKKECGAQNAEQLTILDHLPPRANKTMDEGGKDGVDEFQDLWAGPAGTEKESSLKINVFNKQWSATPVSKEGKLGYDISDESGKKVLHLSPLNGKEMNAEHLKWAAEREITKGYKKATLTEDVAFMKKGSKVWVISNDGKKIKFANLEAGIRGYVASSKIQLEALESQAVQFNGQSCKVLGQTATETLIDSPTEGPVWVSSSELLSTNQPVSTPEAYPIEDQDIESSKVFLLSKSAGEIVK